MRTILSVMALAAVASAGYVVEWSVPLNYSMAYPYTSNKNYSYDISGDSIPEVFVTDSSALRVYNGVTHNLIWSIPNSYTYGNYPYIANTDGDANKELVIAGYNYSSGYSGKFFVYDCQTHTLEYASQTKNGYLATAVADIDGDGKSEICLVSGTSSRTMEVYGSDDIGMREGPEPAVPGRSSSVFPNPAGQLVQFSISQSARGPIAVTDISGRLVRTIVNPGTGIAVWDCRDELGQAVPAGTYIFSCDGIPGRVEVIPDR